VSATTVTGRTYTATRARGLAPWEPQEHTRHLLDQVRAILDEYAAHLPLTARQIFYRLVGAYGYDKTEAAYSRLLEALNRARRARMIPWSSLRDDGTTVERAAGWSSPSSFWGAVRGTAERYIHDLADGQPTAVEVWVEAAGMVPQVSRVAHQYGIHVYSAGGFNSVTEKHSAARRMIDRNDEEGDLETIVLHLGDYDPSGCAIVDSAAEDIEAFCRDYGYSGIVEFKRIAVTPDQIDVYRLETAPQKRTDRRGELMPDTVQAEALAPDELAAEIVEAVEHEVDLDILAATKARGARERAGILSTLDGITIVETAELDDEDE
jgi:hypothetical protein